MSGKHKRNSDIPVSPSIWVQSPEATPVLQSTGFGSSNDKSPFSDEYASPYESADEYHQDNQQDVSATDPFLDVTRSRSFDDHSSHNPISRLRASSNMTSSSFSKKAKRLSASLSIRSDHSPTLSPHKSLIDEMSYENIDALKQGIDIALGDNNTTPAWFPLEKPISRTSATSSEAEDDDDADDEDVKYNYGENIRMDTLSPNKLYSSAPFNNSAHPSPRITISGEDLFQSSEDLESGAKSPLINSPRKLTNAFQRLSARVAGNDNTLESGSNQNLTVSGAHSPTISSPLSHPTDDENDEFYSYFNTTHNSESDSLHEGPRKSFSLSNTGGTFNLFRKSTAETTTSVLPNESIAFTESIEIKRQQSGTPPQQAPPSVDKKKSQYQNINELKLFGKSLRYFEPNNPIRIRCFKIVMNSQFDQILLFLVILQTSLLSYRQWNPSVLHGYIKYGYNWADYVLIAINVIYTIEIASKIVAFGFWDDSQMFKSLKLDMPENELKSIFTANYLFRKFIEKKAAKAAARQRKSNKSKSPEGNDHFLIDPPNFEHSFTVLNDKGLDLLSLRRAYMRNSWNRIDFISTFAFWISLFLSINRYDAEKNITAFRAISAVRVLRLCNLTSGTSTILKALKHAIPQLIDVSLFIGFFWLFFSILGVQSFKSSFRRQCLWTNPDDPSDTYINSLQFCGSSINETDGRGAPYVFADGTSSGVIKGFRCPRNSQCVLYENPYGGSVNFDSIFHSMELVFVIISANTFTDLMYYTMDSDNMAACLFFISAIFILTVWLINVFVAVIVASFKIARMEVQSSKNAKIKKSESYRDWLNKLKKKSLFIRIYCSIEWVFVCIITVDLFVQCFRKSDMSLFRHKVLYRFEATVTIILLVEIIVRFLINLPAWRIFFLSKRNIIDLFLAAITSIIIIPVVKSKLGHSYYWLTIFQVARIYRLVLSIDITRNLWTKILGNGKTIFDLTLFYFVLTGLVSIIVARYYEGVISPDEVDSISFPIQTLPNAFLALYVITSTENWSQILYDIQENTSSTSSKMFGAILLIGWFIFSNMIILNIFIAVIAENLEVSEEEKRTEQIRQFVNIIAKSFQGMDSTRGILKSFKKKVLKSKSTADETERAVVNLLLSGTAVNDFLVKDEVKTEDSSDIKALSNSKWKRIFQVNFWRTTNFLKNPFYRSGYGSRDDTDLKNFNPKSLARSLVTERNLLASKQDKFLKENPTFNNVFYVLKPNHPLRRFCQKIVSSSYGERINGTGPNKKVAEAFIAVMFLSTVALVILACYVTPLYRKEHNLDTGLWNWTVLSEISIVCFFTIEFAIRVIADGLIFTPNAYLRSSWNIIDAIVLVTLWINIISVLKHSSLSRVIRGFQALRALRLLTISETAKNNFHNTMIAGSGKIINAAFVSLCLLIPFSIWGLNIFNGRLGYCVDGVSNSLSCMNEYQNQVFNWNVLSPNVYTHPPLEFNKFGSSFMTLFQITSLEGWVDLLSNLMKSTGIGTVPENYASPYNAIFIIIFNFCGIVFIMNLFVSVIINNYSKSTGRAYFTGDQVVWYQVKKFLSQVSASKRKDTKEFGRFRHFSYKMVIQKNFYWNTLLNIILSLHVLALLLEQYPSGASLNKFRTAAYMMAASAMSIDITMFVIAQGIKLFVSKLWNIFNMLVIVGAFWTTIFSFHISNESVFININKLFLVGMLFFIIPRSNRLSQLLKFASASLPTLISLIFTWLIVFLVFAIALNQIFGLTRVGSNGTGNINLRTVTKSLILLFRMSFGEGWNYIMDDYTVEEPFCYASNAVDGTDCGSKQYAYILFISWNLISMYIFLNMFVSLILESFSYINHRSDHMTMIKRTEVRKFKKSWQLLDPEGTGFIDPTDLPKFLHSLSGVLSFKIYSGRFTVPELKKKWFHQLSSDPYDIFIDFAAMQHTLREIDVELVRLQRELYNKFIEEATLNMEINNEPGISFTRLLLQIPLYTRFEAGQCLNLVDFLERQLLMQKVERRLLNKRINETMAAVICRWKYIRKKPFNENDNDVEHQVDASSFYSRSSYITRAPSNVTDAPSIFITEYDDNTEETNEKNAFAVETNYAPKSPTRRHQTKNERPKLTVRIPSETYKKFSDISENNVLRSPLDYLGLHLVDDKSDSDLSIINNISKIGETLENTQWGSALKNVQSEQKSFDGEKETKKDL